MEYNGQYKEGVIDGKGKMKYKNGDIYEGCWAKGVPSGEGIIHYNYIGQTEGNNISLDENIGRDVL